MDCFEHGVSAADVGATCRANAALHLGRFVRDDVAVEVRQNEDVEVFVDQFVDQVGAHDVNVSVVGLDLRILFRHFIAELQELAVGLLHDVRLRNDGDILVSVVLGVLESSAGEPAGSCCRRHFEVDGNVIVDIDTSVAQRVFAFCILSEEHPVNALLRDHDRSDVGEQIQFLTELDVGALDVRQVVALARGHGRSLQEQVALLDLREHIVRNGLQFFHSVLDGQTLDRTDLDFACLDLFSQQLVQDLSAGIHDDRADAVAIDRSDHNFIHRSKIRSGRCILHSLDSRQLILHDLFKMFLI